MSHSYLIRRAVPGRKKLQRADWTAFNIGAFFEQPNDSPVGSPKLGLLRRLGELNVFEHDPIRRISRALDDQPRMKLRDARITTPIHPNFPGGGDFFRGRKTNRATIEIVRVFGATESPAGRRSEVERENFQSTSSTRDRSNFFSRAKSRLCAMLTPFRVIPRSRASSAKDLPSK